METYTEQLDILTAAGIDFDVVDRCPESNCDVCAADLAWSEAA